MLKDILLAMREKKIVLHDVAPALLVRDRLNKYFQNRWIGTYGPIKWPPRPPDLTPIDFF